MSKPVWTHTHNGEQGEELCCIDNMYFTRFAWDNFLEAYKGKVRPAHRDRPAFDYSPHFGVDFTAPVDWLSPGMSPDLFTDEPTDPMPAPVVTPRQLTYQPPKRNKP